MNIEQPDMSTPALDAGKPARLRAHRGEPPRLPRLGQRRLRLVLPVPRDDRVRRPGGLRVVLLGGRAPGAEQHARRLAQPLGRRGRPRPARELLHPQPAGGRRVDQDALMRALVYEAPTRVRRPERCRGLRPAPARSSSTCGWRASAAPTCTCMRAGSSPSSR